MESFEHDEKDLSAPALFNVTYKSFDGAFVRLIRSTSDSIPGDCLITVYYVNPFIDESDQPCTVYAYYFKGSANITVGHLKGFRRDLKVPNCLAVFDHRLFVYPNVLD